MKPGVSISLRDPILMVCPGGSDPERGGPVGGGPGGGAAVAEMMYVEWNGTSFDIRVTLRCECCRYPPTMQQVYDRETMRQKWVRVNKATGEVEIQT